MTRHPLIVCAAFLVASVVVNALTVRAGLFDAGSRLLAGEDVHPAPWWPAAVALEVALLALAVLATRAVRSAPRLAPADREGD